MHKGNKYIVKGDLSGIQNFIFNVKSEGAAKELKKRSLYVTHLSEKLFSEDKDFFGKNNVRIIYKGGGNYFFEVNTEINENELVNYFEQKSRKYVTNDVYPFFAFAKYDNTFQRAIANVNKQMLISKQQRFLLAEAFAEKNEVLPELNHGKGINHHYPKNEKEEPLDFDHIAEKGNGDNKLAALKLDVDQLGNIFKEQSEENYKILSNELNNFFDERLLKLIYEKEIKDQIYVVFAGGDDCFLIGAWSAIIDLASAIRADFESLNRKLRREVKSLEQDITFSAGITIFPPKYPMQQMADEVEVYLLQAKNEGRNKITILGHALTWEDYEKVLQVKNRLYDLVTKKENPESKSLIQRIKSSKIGYEALQRRANRGKIELPKVWNLKYYLKNINKENAKEVEELFNTYSQSLIDAFMNREKGTNPMIFPIAARLTELLIKNKDHEQN